MPFALLGVEIAVRGGAAPAMAAALGFDLPRPRREPGERAGERGPARLVFVAEAARGPLALPAPAVFAHASVRAARSGDALVLGDETARFTIRPGGARVDVALAPAALAGDAPLVAALHVPAALAFALRHRRLFHVHAATLARGARAVLVAGEAQAGKTTLALALAAAGLDLACDDATYVGDLGGALRVQGVLRPLHLRPATARAFPAAAARAGPPDAEGRRDVDPAAWGPPRLDPLAPGLLLFPEIARQPATSFEALAPAEAFGRLVEASALVVVDGAAHAPAHLALLGRIASEVPALRVALGEDLLRAPREIARAVLAAAARRYPRSL